LTLVFTLYTKQSRVRKDRIDQVESALQSIIDSVGGDVISLRRILDAVNSNTVEGWLALCVRLQQAHLKTLTLTGARERALTELGHLQKETKTLLEAALSVRLGNVKD